MLIGFPNSTSSLSCLLVVATALLQSGQPSLAAADDPGTAESSQLRPPIAQPAQKTEPASTKQTDASSAVDSDFSKHVNALAGHKHSLPLQPATQAASTPLKAVLAAPVPGAQGPSAISISPSTNTVNDEIGLSRPPLKALVDINDYLSPFTLESQSTQSLSLHEALRLGLEQNLDLAISSAATKKRQLAYFSSLGNFLPDPIMGYAEYFPNGSIGLPFFSGAPAVPAVPAASTAAAGSPLQPTSSSGATTFHIDHPFVIEHAGLQYYAYRGGSVLFGALQAKHNYRASRAQEKATLSDTLMNITRNYYNLVLADALLEIRVQAVRTSEEQLRRNTDRFEDGLATNLDVLQSKTQLSRDRQALVDQQIARRSASIMLATSLNVDLGLDFVPPDQMVHKTRLIDPRFTVGDLLRIAVDHRPELKQFEEQRLAAKQAIVVAGATLQPKVTLSGNVYGIGTQANIQPLWLLGVNANWQLKGFGTVDASNVQQARWQARQANLEAQKELQTVLGQVRNSLIQSLDKERNIRETSSEVSSALEELRLAELRKEHGLGTNIDVITAQRDYTQALLDKAQAIINYNIAQAQVLHDTGLISVDALTSGRILSSSRF